VAQRSNANARAPAGARMIVLISYDISIKRCDLLAGRTQT
jgi:hypothetical protein